MTIVTPLQQLHVLLLLQKVSTSFAQAQRCIDDDAFRDEQGYLCSDWVYDGYVCMEAAASFSYTQSGQEALLAACPAADALTLGERVRTGRTVISRVTVHRRPGARP